MAKIFKENSINQENHENIIAVENWYENTVVKMKPDSIINYDKYPDDHPLLRPITLDELNSAIRNTNNKAPGRSGIKIIQFNYSPNNCKLILLNIYNGINVKKILS